MDEFITGEQWSACYAAGLTPWDLGRAHPELIERLADIRGPGRAFVPGCGRGHDALAIAKAGWTVIALDYAAGLREELSARMERVGGDAIIGDAFTYTGGPFDLVFDHTFFCAIDPSRRSEFGSLLDRVTVPGSRLASVVFPIGRSHDEPSPPWGVTTEDLTASLSASWSLQVDEPAVNPPGRRWEARWAEWIRS
jgi:SAM-dependent methyltransferase